MKIKAPKIDLWGTPSVSAVSNSTLNSGKVNSESLQYQFQLQSCTQPKNLVRKPLPSYTCLAHVAAKSGATQHMTEADTDTCQTTQLNLHDWQPARISWTNNSNDEIFVNEIFNALKLNVWNIRGFISSLFQNNTTKKGWHKIYVMARTEWEDTVYLKGIEATSLVLRPSLKHRFWNVMICG
jgi:hypothetical protein